VEHASQLSGQNSAAPLICLQTITLVASPSLFSHLQPFSLPLITNPLPTRLSSHRSPFTKLEVGLVGLEVGLKVTLSVGLGVTISVGLEDGLKVKLLVLGLSIGLSVGLVGLEVGLEVTLSVGLVVTI